VARWGATHSPREAYLGASPHNLAQTNILVTRGEYYIARAVVIIAVIKQRSARKPPEAELPHRGLHASPHESARARAVAGRLPARARPGKGGGGRTARARARPRGIGQGQRGQHLAGPTGLGRPPARGWSRFTGELNVHARGVLADPVTSPTAPLRSSTPCTRTVTPDS
jgi:hypothetical protein